MFILMLTAVPTVCYFSPLMKMRSSVQLQIAEITLVFCCSSWGIANNIDYIAASFVRKATDVTEIRSYAADLIKEM